jgi:hypothetical protein
MGIGKWLYYILVSESTSNPTTYLWRLREEKEVQLLLIHNLGARWG